MYSVTPSRRSVVRVVVIASALVWVPGVSSRSEPHAAALDRFVVGAQLLACGGVLRNPSRVGWVGHAVVATSCVGHLVG